LLTFTHPIVLLPPTTDSWSLTTLARTNLTWALQPYPEKGTATLNITLDSFNKFTQGEILLLTIPNLVSADYLTPAKPVEISLKLNVREIEAACQTVDETWIDTAIEYLLYITTGFAVVRVLVGGEVIEIS
jgi:hypothetical protein